MTSSPSPIASVLPWFSPASVISCTESHFVAPAFRCGLFRTPVPFGVFVASKSQQSRDTGGVMAAIEEMKIVLQVGSELRVTNNGEVIVGNPELELAKEDRAADAVLLYRFNRKNGEP